MTENETVRQGIAQRLTRGILWTVFWGAVLAVVLGVGGGTIAAISSLASGEVSTILQTRELLPPEADAGSATLESGVYETATVTVSGLSTGSAVVLTLASEAKILAGGAVALSLAVLSWNLLRRAPFGPGLSMTVTIGGAVVLLCGIVAIGLGVLGSWMLADQLNASDAGLDGFWPTSAAVDGWPLWLGITMLLLGLAFEYGDRLQRDHETLRRDTDGLV